MLTSRAVKNKRRSEVMHKSEIFEAQNVLEKIPWGFSMQAFVLL